MILALFDWAGQVATSPCTDGPPGLNGDVIRNEVDRSIRHRDLNTASMIARWRDSTIRFAASEPVGVVAWNGDCVRGKDVLVQVLFPRACVQPTQTLVLAPVGPIQGIG